MADENVIPMTHETADRDYPTEIAMATREVDRLTDELAEARFMIQQLEDVFRLNTAAQLLPVFLGRNDMRRHAGVRGLHPDGQRVRGLLQGHHGEERGRLPRARQGDDRSGPEMRSGPKKTGSRQGRGNQGQLNGY
jgi:hypothetical protein